MHSTIKRYKTTSSQSNIAYINVPKDAQMNWDEIPKKLPQKYWKIIEDLVMIRKTYNRKEPKTSELGPRNIIHNRISKKLIGVR